MTKRRQYTALVLRTKAYRETSLMIDFFTAEDGRLSGVQKGYRGRRAHRTIQSFLLGSLDASNTQGLVSVYDFDVINNLAPKGEQTASGFYVLELIFRALGERQQEPLLFAAAVQVLADLQVGTAPRFILRKFERALLDQLGFGLDFERAIDGRTHEPEAIRVDALYSYQPGLGFVRESDKCVAHTGGKVSPGTVVLSGDSLQRIESENYVDARVGRDARLLYQSALTLLIGHEPLESRKLLDSALGSQGHER